MNAVYRVELEPEERAELEAIVARGKHNARKVKRAQILLAADQSAGNEASPAMTDEQLGAAVGVGTSTIYRVRRRWVEEGHDMALHDKPRSGAPRRFAIKDTAVLIGLACTEPPQGCARWTLGLLANKFVTLTEHGSISTETVRKRLHDAEIKPWQHKMWCIPEFNGEYVARMEDVLDLYAEADDPKRPVVSFDETPVQLIGETRVPVAAKPGRKRRVDYEYKRNGTANLFVWVDRHRNVRNVEVTDRRTKTDFAEQMRKLVDEHYADADLVRVVLDNLSTHTPGALYDAFEPCEARRILRKLEFHYTPKHGSWLNMAEIEIGVLSRQCLARRIGDRALLVAEVSAWLARRRESGATIRWMFCTEDARTKMANAYPSRLT